MIDTKQATEDWMPRSTARVAGAAEESPATLAVLIVHEDLPTGLRAKQVLDRLVGEMGFNLRFVLKLWTFDTLRDPLLHQQALRDAAQADLVFISMHGYCEIPLAVCELVNRWLAAKDETPGALVVSLDISARDSVSANSALDCLRTKAVAGGVDLFPHFGATPPAAWNWASE